jgi:hypothetical protein
MANFNNQFATQKLREEATEPETWPDRVPGNNGIIWKKEKEGSRGANYVPYYKGHNIDTGGYNFGNVQQLQKFIDDYVLSNQLYNKLKFEPEKPLDEESVTGTGATFTPGTGEQTAPRATKKVVHKKVKKEGKNIPSDWTDAKSIPNRPTKGGFIYKQLFEALNESYTQFKNETKTRSKPEQFHQAIREVKKKVQQINKMYEYVSRLKTELSEGEDGLKYKMHTEKALNKIKEMVSELNHKIKRFK